MFRGKKKAPPLGWGWVSKSSLTFSLVQVLPCLLHLALSNGKSLTDDLAGEQLTLENPKNNTDILSYYQSKKLQPATGVSYTGGSSLQLQGIGYWVISNDFKVS